MDSIEGEGIMIRIAADSTCDLSEELTTKYDIHILPLHIILGQEEYEDGRNISPEEIYAWSDREKTTPKTSAPSIDDAIALFQSILEDDDELICFAISDDMSSCSNIMRLAAEDMNASSRIHIINSRNLSTGIGLLVVEATIMAKNGLSALEIVAAIDEMIPRVRASFVVDTLIYLYRGGRCNGLAAMIGSAIHLHPRIIVKDGVMKSDKKYRGKMHSVVNAYAKDLEPEMLHSKRDRVFITHSGCDHELVKEIRQYIADLNYYREICVTRAGGVVSSHCGPGTLGILFIEENE